jgi:hypothetical protein
MQILKIIIPKRNQPNRKKKIPDNKIQNKYYFFIMIKLLFFPIFIVFDS